MAEADWNWAKAREFANDRERVADQATVRLNHCPALAVWLGRACAYMGKEMTGSRKWPTKGQPY